MKLKTVVTLRAKAECSSHSKADVQVRDVNLVIDEPVERGGTNDGATPTETAIGVLVGCTNVIGHKCAKALDIDIGSLDIDAACQFDRRGVTLAEVIEVPFVSVTLTVRANGAASADELRQVGELVEKYCPLSKLFRNAGTDIKVDWLKTN